MTRPRMQLKAIAKAINENVPGVRAEIVEGYCNTDRRISGSRLIRPGKGRRGNRLIARDASGTVLIDHNSAEPYRTNAEVLEQAERLWGRFWETDRLNTTQAVLHALASALLLPEGTEDRDPWAVFYAFKAERDRWEAALNAGDRHKEQTCKK